jgi:hypothetical protein
VLGIVVHDVGFEEVGDFAYVVGLEFLAIDVGVEVEV